MATTLAPLDAAIWTRIQSGQSVDLARMLDGFNEAGEPRVQVAVETVFTDGSHPFDVLRPTGMWSDERSQSGEVEALRLTDDDGEWLLLAIATQSDGVFHLAAAGPRTASRWQRVERWIGRTRDISKCFINHKDLAGIGDELAAYGRVEVVKVAARVARDGSSINRGFPVRDGFERPSHTDEIHEIEQLGASIRTLTLHVVDSVDVHLRRIAGATFNGGSFRVFRDVVLRRLEDAAAVRRQLVSDRARLPGSERVESLTVSLGASILEDADDTGDLLAVVGAMPDFSMAVFHRNPYLHFAVTDEVDGSNFDVMVTRADAVDIFPGYRASAASLARVSQRIGEAFGALTIANARLEEPTSIFELR